MTSFYDLTDYYTHQAAVSEDENGNVSFLDRLRMHLAWRLDRGVEQAAHDAVDTPTAERPTLLEIGCGHGENLVRFRERGFSVVGVEPDEKARATAKESNLTVHEGTAEELPAVLAGTRYDVVLMSHVLEHCIDINRAVLNAKGHMTEDGCFLVETPNAKSLGFRDQLAAWPWSDIPRHLNFFTPDSLRRVLTKHGLKVVEVRHQGFCRQFSNPWLAIEREVTRVFVQTGEWPKEPNYKLRAWRLLVRSVFASRDAKYDSVRLVARLR